MSGYIIRMELVEELLYNYARRVNKPTYDMGYLVKGALSGAMGEDHRPRVYSIEPERGGRIPILGYTQETADELKTRISQFGDPEASSIIELKTFFSKPLPERWPDDVGFSVRISPYVNSAVQTEERQRKRVPSPPAPAVLHRRRARGLDYYVHAMATNPGISREDAYVEWLERRFENSGAEIVEAQLLRCERLPSFRDNRMVMMMSARMAGVLHIADQAAFMDFVTGGRVSRQKFAGFGMVKLHPLQ